MEQLIEHREWNIYPNDELEYLETLNKSISELMKFDIRHNKNKIDEYKVTIYNLEGEIITVDNGFSCLRTLQIILLVKKSA